MRSRYFVISFVLLGMVFAPTSNNLFSDEEIMLTSGRSGPDAEVGGILSPRATTTDSMTGEKLHTLKAGDDVNFEAFITNLGDSAITEMEISVTVYLSYGGVRGNIAMDAAGNELSWTNGDVVCYDAFVCPWSSLGVGENLDSGKYTITYQGSPVTWTPMVGEYIVVVETDAVGDADPSNDDYENLVSVVDWTDIIVDLAWDSGQEIEGGSGDKAFTLTVETGGSSSWSARGIQLELAVEGTLLTALDNDGTDIMGTNVIGDNSSATSGFGTYGSTTTWMHQDDANNTTSGERHVIDFQGSSTWNGVVSPDTSASSGDYSIEVSLVSYVMYGQFSECTETTFIHYCEVVMTQDDVAATSEDMIEGKVQTFHDIGVTSLVINQGYDTDGNGNPTGTPNMPGITEGPLNPAWSSVQASVRHMGSDLFETYDWKVTFEIQNTITGSTSTLEADNCTFGNDPTYEHSDLGDSLVAASAFETGEACVWFEFTPGIYNITATISMVGGTAGTVDMSAGNDESGIFEIYAFRNRPSVTLSLMEDPESIVFGPEGYITLIADAYDTYDWSGQSLSYVWTHPGIGPFGSNCDGQGPAFATCQLTAADGDDWVGTKLYSVNVSDEYGSYDQASMSVKVWNKIVATDTTDSGIGMEYDLTYYGANEFTVDLEDSTKSYTKDLTQFGYSGEYTSEAVVDYTPSTTYMAQDVLAQEIDISFDASAITPTSVFWVINGLWTELTTTISATGNDGTIDIDMGADNQVMPQGELVLMGGEVQHIYPPTAWPTALYVNAGYGGEITASWSYEGIVNSGIDWLEMTICDSNGNCETSNYDASSVVSHTMSETVHDVTYTYTLKVCNPSGCNPYTSTSFATADSRVDGDPSATDVSVSNKAGEDAWTISWTVEGDDSDVDGWMVCWSDYNWVTFPDMPCNDAVIGGLTTTIDIEHPSGTGTQTYHFAVVPYDDKGNFIFIPWPQTDIILTHEDDTTEPDNSDRDQDGITNSFDDCPDEFGTSNKGQHSNRLIGCQDSDGDGWADEIDAFSGDSSEWLDSDGDGCGDNSDAFPQDPDECIDTDEDGYGDNSDLFPEDAMEFEDKDGDGVGDNSDKCDTTTTGTDIDSSGCEIQDETSTLVIGLVSGVGGLLLVIIVLLVVIKRGSSKQDSNDNSVNPEKRSFNETNYGFSNQVTPVTPMMNNYNQQQFSAPAMSPMPTISDMGEVSSDGYEWLEYPEGSNEWYWRANPGTPWTKHQ